MSRVNDTGHVKGRLRPSEKISVVLRVLLVERCFEFSRHWETCMFTYQKSCPFLTVVREP